MKEAVVALISLLIIVTVATFFKSTHGIKCHACAYYKIGHRKLGDSACKYGSSSSSSSPLVPVEECSENSIIPTTAVIPDILKVHLLGESSQVVVGNEGIAENETRYGCRRSEVVADVVNGGRGRRHSFSMVSRSCTISPEKMSGCDKGSIVMDEELLAILDNLIPEEAQVQGLEDFETCVCFEDKCN